MLSIEVEDKRRDWMYFYRRPMKLPVATHIPSMQCHEESGFRFGALQVLQEDHAFAVRTARSALIGHLPHDERLTYLATFRSNIEILLMEFL